MLDSRAATGFHVVLSYGDVYRQSGYRTKVLGELQEYERHGKLQPFLIAFDRDAKRIGEMDFAGVPFSAHSRSAVARYYKDIATLSRSGPIRIVHAHNLYSGALALSARPFYGYKVLLELHGRIPVEYVVEGRGGTASHWILKRLESWVVRSADHIIPISSKLKDYLVGEYGLEPSDLSVIPDCADPSAFRWDAALRSSTRRRLNVENKFVCVHLGSFFMWYDPQLILKAFKRIRNSTPTAHLLVVTEKAAETRDYLLKELSPDEFTVIGVPHCDVPALLAASDLGFLLLRSTPNIKVSSPAKFSEYLNSGLPVLISAGVGDFSTLVLEKGIGAIASDHGDFDVSFVQSIMSGREEIAARATAAGLGLTWRAFRPVWNDVVERLVARE